MRRRRRAAASRTNPCRTWPVGWLAVRGLLLEDWWFPPGRPATPGGPPSWTKQGSDAWDHSSNAREVADFRLLQPTGLGAHVGQGHPADRHYLFLLECAWRWCRS